MKLEKYEDKSKKKRKVILISISVILLISVSLLLYKTFASFSEEVEFPMMNGKVDYFGNSDIYFAFYKGDEELEEMPQKDNKENLVFDYGTCDNGASIKWDNEAWGPMVKDLSTNKTKCSIYFKEYVPAFYEEVVKCGQGGTSATTCITNNASLDESLINDDYGNLRYTGSNPNNYVTFNSETWRIIGIIDGKLKIMRSTILDKRTWGYSNTWSNSTLANYLNNSYDVSNNNMVVSGSWNVGGASSYNYTAKAFYSYEQGTKWTGKVGLMTASDYGYAVGGDVGARCRKSTLYYYNAGGCISNDWMYITVDWVWTMTPVSSYSDYVFGVVSPGDLTESSVYIAYGVIPVVYLNENVRITGGTGEEGSPFTLTL